jgi:hypothetical protein
MDILYGSPASAWCYERIYAPTSLVRRALKEAYATEGFLVLWAAQRTAHRPCVIQAQFGLRPPARALNKLTGTELEAPKLDHVALCELMA